MAGLSRKAARDVAELRSYYREQERPEASQNLVRALRRASDRIDRLPEDRLPAPRPYPELAHAGERWIKEGRYWIAYTARPPLILAVLFDQADIPRRR